MRRISIELVRKSILVVLCAIAIVSFLIAVQFGSRARAEENTGQDAQSPELKCLSISDPRLMEIARLHLVCTPDKERKTGYADFKVLVFTAHDKPTEIQLREAKDVSLKVLNCMYSVYSNAEWPRGGQDCEYTVGFSDEFRGPKE
ncbi:MAG: hypothetical protein IT350_14280 [Deltaproteobacteria bacterium]|nr:hypothetical protein [Deltaproteobacteria bacterium]